MKRFLWDNGIRDIELLAYHRMGVGKGDLLLEPIVQESFRLERKKWKSIIAVQTELRIYCADKGDYDKYGKTVLSPRIERKIEQLHQDKIE